MSSNLRPSWTIAKATSGCTPTITVCAPRSRVMCAIVRNDRAANESITSIAVTSTTMPCARDSFTRSMRSRRRRSTSTSVSAACTVAIKTVPCFRMATGMRCSRWSAAMLAGTADFVTQQAFALLDTALQVADGVHLGKVQPDLDQGQSDLRGQAGDDHARTHQPRRLDGLHQMVGHRGVDGGHAGDVDHDNFGAVGANH